ncbi:MAG: HEPN domain-containing protein [Candidatus Heimdallarchaeota archaeon]
MNIVFGLHDLLREGDQYGYVNHNLICKIRRWRRVYQVIDSLEEAKKCYKSGSYSQTIEICDQTIQQLLMTMLEFVGIDMEHETNQLPIVLSTLHEHRIRVQGEQELRWLRSLLNRIRHDQKRPSQWEAEQALHVAQQFSQEVTDLLGRRSE